MKSHRSHQYLRRKDEDADEDEGDEREGEKDPGRNNIRLCDHYRDISSASTRSTGIKFNFVNSSSSFNFKWIAIGLGIFSLILLLILISLTVHLLANRNDTDSGEASITEIMGGRAKPNQLIFSDDFDFLDLKIWRRDRYFSSDGFVIYGTNPKNSYTENGILFIEPTPTVDEYNDTFVSKTRIIKFGQHIEKESGCSSFLRSECEKTVGSDSYNRVLNPIMSASLKTSQSFTFKYGKIEMRARMPKGDWISTEISLMPAFNFYGEPTNTEMITLISTRGNSYYLQEINGTNYGNERICTKLIYSDFETEAIGTLTEFCTNTQPGHGFGQDFHHFKYEWTPDDLKIFIDEKLVGRFVVTTTPFIRSSARHIVLPGDYKVTTKKKSFDQQFYLQLKVGVGVGFPDTGFRANDTKPWRNYEINTGQAAASFSRYEERMGQTWANGNSALQVDYIRVTSL